MAGIIGAIGPGAEEHFSDDFRSSIALGGTSASRSSSLPRLRMATVAPSERLLPGRVVESPAGLFMLAGHIVADAPIDWEDVLAKFRTQDFSFLGTWSGRFALAVFDRSSSELYLVTDRLGQYPLYVAADERGLAFSTSQASFCRWLNTPDLNTDWFLDLFLANFSFSHSSFLRGVSRLEPASVIRIDQEGSARGRWQYAPDYRTRPVGGGKEDEVRRAIGVFKERMPRYAADTERLVLGLTSGFDSRAVLAMFAEHPGLSGFTYGIAGCEDIKVGQKLARAAGLDYRTVVFDDEFENRLGDLMVETVWLSGGLQSCTRASLLFAYRRLLAECPDVDAILSGVSGDQLFRGHGNVPSIVSAFVSHLFEHGAFSPEMRSDFEGMFVDPGRAMERMTRFESFVKERYGDPTDTATHLGYLTYEVPAEYFAGEACLVDNLADFRSPFCDRDIVDLAYSSRLSSRTFSRYKDAGYGNLQKNYLMAELISTEPRAAAVPIQRRPVRAFASGKPIAYYAASAFSRLKRLLTGDRPQPHLENWNRWFAGPMKGRIDRLLAPGARCERVLARSFIDRCIRESDAFWLNKLVTAESVMRLAEEGCRASSLLDEAA